MKIVTLIPAEGTVLNKQIKRLATDINKIIKLVTIRVVYDLFFLCLSYFRRYGENALFEVQKILLAILNKD